MNGRRPVLRASADIYREVLQDDFAFGGMVYFGMEL